jgi:hypothetical protein
MHSLHFVLVLLLELKLCVIQIHFAVELTTTCFATAPAANFACTTSHIFIAALYLLQLPTFSLLHCISERSSFYPYGLQ